MNTDLAVHFIHRLRAARMQVFDDAEASLPLIQVFEALGRRLRQAADLGAAQANHRGLGDLQPDLCRLAGGTPTVQRLFKQMKDARNDAVHTGAHARHLASTAARFSLLLEEGLTAMEPLTVGHLCVANVIAAEPWHTVGDVRSMMLEHQFSFVPVRNSDAWQFIAATELARFVQADSRDRPRRALELSAALTQGLVAHDAVRLHRNTAVLDALAQMGDRPALVFNDTAYVQLCGIVTAFDLL